jgi:bifunctional ADP-heptose synthase (sugar kinase/adenylyltransferase)
MDYFFESDQQRTFTYCKPLVMDSDSPPRELNRLDSKNWHPTPQPLQNQLGEAVRNLAKKVDAVIVLDQVEQPDTGVVTRDLLNALNDIRDQTMIVGDSRRGLKGWPDIIYKMNAAELTRLTGQPEDLAKEASGQLARETGQPVFVTLAQKGIIGANPNGDVDHCPALPSRNEIDIVGAGDAVMANLTASLVYGATIGEALKLSNAAASVVIHKLGTTGTASIEEIGAKLS